MKGTLCYRVRPSAKAMRTITKQTTDERIISLRKALGMDLRREAREYKLKMELRRLEIESLQN